MFFLVFVGGGSWRLERPDFRVEVFRFQRLRAQTLHVWSLAVLGLTTFAFCRISGVQVLMLS